MHTGVQRMILESWREQPKTQSPRVAGAGKLEEMVAFHTVTVIEAIDLFRQWFSKDVADLIWLTIADIASLLCR